jgi:hypothetical protein
MRSARTAGSAVRPDVWRGRARHRVAGVLHPLVGNGHQAPANRDPRVSRRGRDRAMFWKIAKRALPITGDQVVNGQNCQTSSELTRSPA